MDREETRPNIVMIVTDQHRYDSLGCYGEVCIDTPALDALAADGAVFDNCYVNGTICTPSRASMMTGKALLGHGVYKLHDNLPSDQVMFPKRLQERGYKTALIGKLHVCGRVTEARERHPHDGFDMYELCNDSRLHLDSPYHAHSAWIRQQDSKFWEKLAAMGRSHDYFPERLHNSYWAAERTIRFLESHDGERPFFCQMSLFDPHDPYDDHPPEALAMVNEHLMKPPQPAEADADVPEGVRREREKFRKQYEGKHDLQRHRQGYYASVAFLDRQIGRVLRTLERLDYADNTLVIFLSDHGDMLGDRELITKGAYFYDACAKVPFIMRFPGRIPGGVRRTQLIQPHDIAATILTVAGCGKQEMAEWMPDSLDLLPVASSNGDSRDHAVTLYRDAKYWQPPLYCSMYRESRYKLNIYHDGAGQRGRQQGQLFDMEADPEERLNLWDAPEYAAVKTSLLLRYSDWTTRQESLYVSGRGGEGVPQPGSG